jgi:hypothetical protein
MGAAESAALPIEASTMIDREGSYHFMNHPGEQFLFSHGHSAAGETGNCAYAGLY